LLSVVWTHGDKATFSQQVTLVTMDFNGEGVFRNTLDLPEISQVHQNSIKLNCRHLQEKKEQYCKQHRPWQLLIDVPADH
jgi:hypothetical protein